MSSYASNLNMLLVVISAYASVRCLGGRFKELGEKFGSVRLLEFVGRQGSSAKAQAEQNLLQGPSSLPI